MRIFDTPNKLEWMVLGEFLLDAYTANDLLNLDIKRLKDHTTDISKYMMYRDYTSYEECFRRLKRQYCEFNKETSPWYNKTHMGDCTQIPITCMVCYFERMEMTGYRLYEELHEISGDPSYFKNADLRKFLLYYD